MIGHCRPKPSTTNDAEKAQTQKTKERHLIHVRAAVTLTFANAKKMTENVPICAHVLIVRTVIESFRMLRV